jgi:hypothetical protein
LNIKLSMLEISSVTGANFLSVIHISRFFSIYRK